MGRGRRGFFDDLIKLPWPVAVVAGLPGNAFIGHDDTFAWESASAVSAFDPECAACAA